MKNVIFLSVGALLVVAISVGATYFLVGGGKSTESTSRDAETKEAKTAVPSKPAKSANSENSAKGPPIYYELHPDFVVLFRDAKTAHYIKASVQVMTRSEEIIEAIKLHNPVIRNAVIMILSAQDSEHLSTREGMEELRAGILTGIQKVLTEQTGNPGIEDVYFSNFIMQ